MHLSCKSDITKQIWSNRNTVIWLDSAAQIFLLDNATCTCQILHWHCKHLSIYCYLYNLYNSSCLMEVIFQITPTYASLRRPTNARFVLKVFFPMCQCATSSSPMFTALCFSLFGCFMFLTQYTEIQRALASNLTVASVLLTISIVFPRPPRPTIFPLLVSSFPSLLQLHLNRTFNLRHIHLVHSTPNHKRIAVYSRNNHINFDLFWNQALPFFYHLINLNVEKCGW